MLCLALVTLNHKLQIQTQKSVDPETGPDFNACLGSGYSPGENLGGLSGQSCMVQEFGSKAEFYSGNSPFRDIRQKENQKKDKSRKGKSRKEGKKYCTLKQGTARPFGV